jgi:uncharacterized protein (DUF1330 family)
MPLDAPSDFFGTACRFPGETEETMAAYILVMPWELDPSRPAGTMDPYFDQVERTMAPYGGRYRRLRLDAMDLLEGDWRPPLGFAMIEFPSMEQARSWYHTPRHEVVDAHG